MTLQRWRTLASVVVASCVLGCGGGHGHSQTHTLPTVTPTPKTTPGNVTQAWGVGALAVVADDGARGVVIHSADNGATWSTAATTNADLLAIQFSDESNGWAVGRGIIIHTADGGSNWQIQRQEPGELLTDVTFFDETDGVAVGASPPQSIDAVSGPSTCTCDDERWNSLEPSFLAVNSC
jgi:photosystem II stability/assembly factor-like uncharacterized protein